MDSPGSEWLAASRTEGTKRQTRHRAKVNPVLCKGAEGGVSCGACTFKKTAKALNFPPTPLSPHPHKSSPANARRRTESLLGEW